MKERPQYKGISEKVIIMKPKKPNSALRKVVKVLLTDNRSVWAYIPGEGHNIIPRSIVLIRPGKVQDLPGVKYKVIRGTRDCAPVNRKSSRSLYGKSK